MLNDKDPVVFELSTNPDDFAVCARMMTGTDPWIKLGLDYEHCLKAFDGPFKEIFLLKKDKQIVGFVVMQTQGTFKGYIQTICIDAAKRNHGYGSRILQFCAERIFRYSPNIFICVSSFNEGAIQLYYKFGFELIGELKNFVKEGFTELLMRKSIGPNTDFKRRM